MDFTDIIGHEKIILNLQNAIKNNHIAHNYLFNGAKSIGKETIAKIFAKTLLCKEKGIEPCNICSSCIQFEKGNHPDFKIVIAEDKTFKKGQVIQIQQDIRIRPFEGNRKVYILKDVEKMNREAQNTFLKTLEEPPEYAVIIMTTTNVYNLLPTVISRSQVLKFLNVEAIKIETALINKFKILEDEAQFLSLYANGIVGRAIKLSKDEGFKDLRERTIEAIDSTINGDKIKVFSTSEFFEKNKDDIEEILDMILLWFRDVMIYKETNNEQYLVNKDKVYTIINHSKSLKTDKISDIIETIVKTKDEINSSVNFLLAIEMMLLKIQEVN